MGNKLTTEDFIQKSRNVHGDLYDYSKTVYTLSTKKVEIICREHGVFWQKANTHLCGSGCLTCGNIARGLGNKVTVTDFKTRANIIHDNFYRYHKVDFKAVSDNVIITCPLHGDFEQRASSHITAPRSGCRKCWATRLGDTLRSSTGVFIHKAKNVHGDTYDYRDVVYKGSVEKVVILCETHGPFLQTPNSHLNGSGCIPCANEGQYGRINRTNLDRSLSLRSLPAIIYQLELRDKSTGEVFKKIGITTKTLDARVSSIPLEVLNKEVIFEGTLNEAFELENAILEIMSFNKRSYRPSNPFGGYTECFI